MQCYENAHHVTTKYTWRHNNVSSIMFDIVFNVWYTNFKKYSRSSYFFIDLKKYRFSAVFFFVAGHLTLLREFFIIVVMYSTLMLISNTQKGNKKSIWIQRLINLLFSCILVYMGVKVVVVGGGGLRSKIIITNLMTWILELYMSSFTNVSYIIHEWYFDLHWIEK